MKKRVLSLALCLVLVVGLFSGLTVNASAATASPCAPSSRVCPSPRA